MPLYYGLTKEQAEIYVQNPKMAEFFENVMEQLNGVTPERYSSFAKLATNYIQNNLVALGAFKDPWG